MSLSYMRQSATFLSQWGFEVEEKEGVLGSDAAGDCISHQFRLRREGEELVLEAVVHPTYGLRYFLEIVHFHGMSSFSFPLDSWKHRDERIEFKYYCLPNDGRGLSFILTRKPGAAVG